MMNRESIRTAAASMGMALLVLSWPLAAAGIDGALEINQACAVETGCFTGDAPGFPVTISVPGKYVLTSGIVVSSTATDGLEVQIDGVSIDLRGFTLDGPTTCSETGGSVTCGPLGTGRGIDGVGRERVSVRNGTVMGFALGGIELGHYAIVEGVTAESNGGEFSSGIIVGYASTVRGNTVHLNDGNGIVTGSDAVIENNVAAGNGLAGISGDGSLVGNIAFGNGRDGILAAPQSVVRANNVRENGRHGINASNGAQLVDNTAQGNAGNGIHGYCESAVERNVLTSNGGVGIFLSGAVPYRGNTVNSNTAGSVSGGMDMGGNVCDGAMSCP